MPIPVIADHYLAQVVMKPDTVPSSNSFVNTFFFLDTVGGRSHDAVADDIETVIENFYNATHGTASVDIASELSAVIDPTLTELRVYDLGEAAPRTPEIRGMGSWTVSSTALPNEVAAVISYRSGLVPSPTGGTNNKRQRGRLFIGPLGSGAGVLVAGEQDLRIASGYVLTLAESAEYLRDQTDADVQWMQYSRVGNVMAAVIQGFVNNRFDTQRRRGALESSRTVW